MASVETVRGPVDVADLGTTYMHEHVFVLTPEVEENYPGTFDEEVRVADAVTKLNELKSLGVDTIVDPTVVGLGRYIPRIETVAAQTELNIIVATGLYTYNDVPFAFHYRGPETLFGGPDPLIEMFVGDIENGIAGTPVKAGFLKCAIDEPGLTHGVERVMRAVAQAQLRTDKPITVHTHAQSRTGNDVLLVLREEGVDLAKVVIGHSGDTTDLRYLAGLMDAGAYIGMDRFGLDVFLPFEQRVDTVVQLCQQGYAEKMVLAHDVSCFIDWFSEADKKAVVPNWHYRHIHDDVLPALRERGVTEEQITTMLVDNPRKYFS